MMGTEFPGQEAALEWVREWMEAFESRGEIETIRVTPSKRWGSRSRRRDQNFIACDRDRELLLPEELRHVREAQRRTRTGDPFLTMRRAGSPGRPEFSLSRGFRVSHDGADGFGLGPIRLGSGGRMRGMGP
jgi:hypothetical protein